MSEWHTIKPYDSPQPVGPVEWTRNKCGAWFCNDDSVLVLYSDPGLFLAHHGTATAKFQSFAEAKAWCEARMKPAEPEKPAEQKPRELFVAEFLLDSGTRLHLTAGRDETRLKGSRVNGQAPIRVFPVREVLPGQPDPEKLAVAVREVMDETKDRAPAATPLVNCWLEGWYDKLAAALEGSK